MRDRIYFVGGGVSIFDKSYIYIYFLNTSVKTTRFRVS